MAKSKNYFSSVFKTRAFRRRKLRRCAEIFMLFSFTSCITIVTYLLYEYHPSVLDSLIGNQKDVLPNGGIRIDSSGKIDWHDVEFMRREKERVGNGEQGEEATLPPDYDKNKYDELYRSNGFNGLLSDYISINRSIPDLRHKDCRKVKYRLYLPQASIIIPIHNEHWTTLLRTVYSVLNRSPEELIKEIILVDDGSTKPHMKKQLDDYAAAHLPKVRVFHIEPRRKGLITARLLGALNATGEVLIFLDSHVEANINWLPPLLDPIAENYKTCVCPFIDVIEHETFAVRPQDEGARGAFDWEMYYKRLPLLPEDRENPTKPFKSPVMAGGLFAISSRFFWELGGYDPGLQIWGGEQYELSFKIWMCGGIMIDAPCSRVGHVYRGKHSPFSDPGVGDFMAKNLKRVAEVWMDEYAEYLYSRRPSYKSVDPGDLTAQFKIREKLKCKSFKWFMEEIAFDLIKRYPIEEPPDYGSGKIRPLINSELCLTLTNDARVELYKCSEIRNKQHRQGFLLSWHKDIQVEGTGKCLDVSAYGSEAPISIYNCHGEMGNQLWRYDAETHQFYFGHHGDRCLACDIIQKIVFVETCDKTSKAQRWQIDSLNLNALVKWKETIPLLD